MRFCARHGTLEALKEDFHAAHHRVPNLFSGMENNCHAVGHGCQVNQLAPAPGLRMLLACIGAKLHPSSVHEKYLGYRCAWPTQAPRRLSMPAPRHPVPDAPRNLPRLAEVPGPAIRRHAVPWQTCRTDAGAAAVARWGRMRPRWQVLHSNASSSPFPTEAVSRVL